jgi:pyroglutamyl-peptidase
VSDGPRLLVTGFGPFPGAPENPSETLVRALAEEPPETFGASAFNAVVLKTEYRGSWVALQRLYSSFAPDVVLHFGLAARSDVIRIECVGRNSLDQTKPDAAGHAPSSAVRSGKETLASTFPATAIAAALKRAGFPAALSDDAGGYVCNATLYRSLHAAPPARRVGLVHVPPLGTKGLTPERLYAGAALILRTATTA